MKIKNSLQTCLGFPKYPIHVGFVLREKSYDLENPKKDALMSIQLSKNMCDFYLFVYFLYIFYFMLFL